MIKVWSQFFESLTIPGIKIDEFIAGVETASKQHKNVLAMFFNTYESYVDLSDPQKHIFKINDLTGDILNNGRIQFSAMIFGQEEMEKVIKNNIANLSMAEFYSNIPNQLNIFGVDIKPISFINKDDLKFSFENILTVKELVRIITSVSNGYFYVGEKDGYHIWRKNL